MEVHGRQTLVVPQLVTGCKIWHLRPEGSFYPKTAWCTAVNSLPEGSQVSMLLACSQRMQLRQMTTFGNHAHIICMLPEYPRYALTSDASCAGHVLVWRDRLP